MEKNVLQYIKRNCDSTLTNKIYSEIEKKGINIGTTIDEGFYVFDNGTYIKLRCQTTTLTVSSVHYLTMTIEQPVRKIFGIKKGMKLPKDLTDILESFNFEKD